MNITAEVQDAGGEAKKDRPKSRKFMIIMLLVLLTAVGAGIYWWYLQQTVISTQNAKVATDIIDLSFGWEGDWKRLWLLKETRLPKARN